jgi:hypothetical protein
MPALGEQAEATALAQTRGLLAAEAFDEDELYAAMELLNGQWAPLERDLYQAAFPQGVRLVLYDLPEHQQLELGDRNLVLEVTHRDKRYLIGGGVWRQTRDVVMRPVCTRSGKGLVFQKRKLTTFYFFPEDS